MDHQAELKFSLGIKHQIFNNELRKRREAMGFTQQQLAEVCGMGKGSIAHFEAFRSYPQDWQAKKLAEVLDTSIDILFPKWLELFKPKRTSITTEHLVTENILGNQEVLQLTAPDQDLYDHFDKALLKEEISKQIKTLSDRERRVLEERFGLNGNTPKTLEEAGKIFGVTRTRIQQIEAKAIRKLRHPSRGRALRAFLDDPYFNLQCAKGHITPVLVRLFSEGKTYICETYVHTCTEEQIRNYEHPDCYRCELEAKKVV